MKYTVNKGRLGYTMPYPETLRSFFYLKYAEFLSRNSLHTTQMALSKTLEVSSTLDFNNFVYIMVHYTLFRFGTD